MPRKKAYQPGPPIPDEDRRLRRCGQGCKTLIPPDQDRCPYHRAYRIVEAKLRRAKLYDDMPRTRGLVAIASHFAADWAVHLIAETRMTILVYVHSEGRLYFNFAAGAALEVLARSGPWGKGLAPQGGYTVERPVAIDAIPENAAYTDALGFAWFAKLTPRFMTERSGFGIHPDGNVPGTRGCIGIAIRDTRPVFNYLTQAADPIILLVVK